jgi:hypothetical protein
MVGAGEYASIPEAANATVKTKKTYRPSGADYEDAYRRYCALDNKLNTKE